jgi:hypothetical protein
MKNSKLNNIRSGVLDPAYHQQQHHGNGNMDQNSLNCNNLTFSQLQEGRNGNGRRHAQPGALGLGGSNEAVLLEELKLRISSRRSSSSSTIMIPQPQSSRECLTVAKVTAEMLRIQLHVHVYAHENKV